MRIKSHAAYVAALCLVLSQGCFAGQTEGDQVSGADFTVNGYAHEPNTNVRVYAARVATPTTLPPSAEWDEVGTDFSNNSALPFGGLTWSIWSAALNTTSLHWRLYLSNVQMYDANGVPAYVVRKGQRIQLSGFVDSNNDGSFQYGEQRLIPFIADFAADHDGDGLKCVYSSGNPETEYLDEDCIIEDDYILTLTYPCGASGQPACSADF